MELPKIIQIREITIPERGFCWHLREGSNLIYLHDTGATRDITQCLRTLTLGLRGIEKLPDIGVSEVYFDISLDGKSERVELHHETTSANIISSQGGSITCSKQGGTVFVASDRMLDFISDCTCELDPRYKMVYITKLPPYPRQHTTIEDLSLNDIDIFPAFNELFSGTLELCSPSDSTALGIYSGGSLKEFSDSEFELFCVLGAISESHTSGSVIVVQGEIFQAALNSLYPCRSNFFKSVHDYCLKEDIQVIICTSGPVV